MGKLLITLSIFLSFQAHAQQEIPEAYDYNARAFNSTVALCSQVQTLQESLHVNWGMLQFFFRGVKSGAKLWGPDAIQMSQATDSLIKSDGFNAALYKCFGDSVFKRRAFIATIIFDDAAGHFVGVGAWLIPISAVARIFKAFSVAMMSPTVAAAIGRSFAVVQKVGIVSFGSYVAWNEYEKYKNRNQAEEKFSQYTDSVADSTKAQTDATFDILQVLLDQTNKDLAHNPDDLTRAKLLRRKALLEHQLQKRKDQYSLNFVPKN